jgi:hypothetical protein
MDDPLLKDVLGRLDRILGEIVALREQLVGQAHLPTPAVDGNGLDSADDFRPEHLIEISTARCRENPSRSRR